MNLQGMREVVRTQLDLDIVDLTDPLLDTFIQEGYDRTIELESRWPFFGFQWVVNFDAEGLGALPPDAEVLDLIVSAEDGRLLKRLPMRLSVMTFPPGQATSGTPMYWTRLDRNIRIFPSPGAAYAARAVGFRRGADWISVAGAQCDADRRLHIPICWYAASLAYAQQEDEILEQTYMNRYRESVGLARDAIMRPNIGEPRQVFYTHYPTGPSGPGGPAQIVIQTPVA